MRADSCSAAGYAWGRPHDMALILAIALGSCLGGCADGEPVESCPIVRLLPPQCAVVLQRDILGFLDRGGVAWRLVHKSSLGPSDPRPQFAECEILVPDYEHLGWPGEVRCTFVNGRMLKTSFIPLDVDYFRMPESEVDLRDCPPGVSCSDSTDVRGRRRRTWTSDATARFVRAWIREYS